VITVMCLAPASAIGRAAPAGGLRGCDGAGSVVRLRL
jgi:hypothetical protein